MTFKLKNEKSLKKQLLKNREFKTLNGFNREQLKFLEVSNHHATYYSVDEQSFLLLYAPFTLEY